MRTSHPSGRIAVLAALVAGSLFTSDPAAAQQRPDAPVLPINEVTGVPYAASARPRGFNLFAEEDLAGTSLRLTGGYRYPLINAGGLCPFANTSGDIFNTSCGQGPGGSTFFHATPVWGIGPTDFQKIKDVWPAITNMRAPVGYSTPWRITSIAPITIRINSADGQFGQYFAGVTSLNGAGCRDMQGASGAGLPQNFTLLASVDCPETWASTGFGGMYELPDSVWKQRFDANPASFRWDDWKIPASAFSDRPLGNNATYGAFSDYPREIVQLYGGITPLGKAGAPPGERGFPLGIYVRADAWKFDRPSLRNGVFIRWLVVNNSEKIWGQPIDYDRLFMGVDPGYIPVGQAPSAYNHTRSGTHVMSGGGMSGKCTTTFPKRLNSAGGGCNGSATQAQHVIMFLKSPLGDLRNKQFSDPTSQFYFPNHQEADDTITFNQWRRGGFGAQEQFSWRRSDRAMWGLLSGDEDAWLDGRVFSDFTAAQIWTYFRYEFTDGTQSAANLKYGRTVIGDVPGYGKWDYDDDGIQDTIKMPDCGSLGCAGLWGDSVAGGWPNTQAGNIGNFLGVGPFKLKAGDTTEFIFYMGSVSGDTLQTNRLIASATTAFFKNFAGASAYPTPTFTANDVQLASAWIRDSTANNQNTQIRIQVKMPPRTDDIFLKSVLARINGSDAVATNLRTLNPSLAAVVTGRMRQNLSQVLVFKSCDNGVSWTNDAGCTSATGTFRTRDQNGTDIGLGWRPFATLNADSITGVLSSYVVTDNVQSGREYVYSFVTKTRGLFDIKVNVSPITNAGGQIIGFNQDNLQNVLGVDIDTITSSLSPNGPFTVHAYAPISVPAGTIYARVDTSRTQSQFTTNKVDNSARTASVNGAFRMRFGNRFIITRTLDTVSSARTTTIIRQSVYARATRDPNVAATLNFVAAADTFVSNHDFTYQAPAANALRTTPRSVTGTVQTFVDTIALPGYVVAQASGGSAPYYVSIGSNFLGTGTGALTQGTAEFEGAPWYPGFTATVTGETAPPATRFAFIHRAPYGIKDSLNTGVVNGNGVIYQSSTSAASTTNPSGPTGLKSSPGGWYYLEWQGAAFGPGENNSGFFSFAPTQTLQPIIDASIAARPVAMVADTTTALRNLVLAGANNLNSTGTPPAGLPAGNGTNISFPLGTRPSVAARLPFRVIGVNGQPAKVVMNQRHVPGNVTDSLFRNSRLFGTNGDTVRVMIPVDAWMPGDTIYVVENIVVDSTIVVGGNTIQVVHDTTINGKLQTLPIQVTRELYGAMFPIGCASNTAPTRTTCNPIRVGTKGGTGYLPYEAGNIWKMLLNRPFEQNSEVSITAVPTQSGALKLNERDMSLIHVVPNPFVVQGAYDKLTSGRVVDANFVKFTNVPDQGLLRIYSISGQLMQQISWTKSDLLASGNGSPHGDLPYNLRTREGLDLGSGLYVFVLTARGENANGQVARGKFVVIR